MSMIAEGLTHLEKNCSWLCGTANRFPLAGLNCNSTKESSLVSTALDNVVIERSGDDSMEQVKTIGSALCLPGGEGVGFPGLRP